MSKRFWVVLAVAGQLSVLLSFIVRHEYRSRAWQPVRLLVEPIDPYSLFRGKYVRLGYEFTRLKTTQAGWKSGDEIYIRLAPRPDGLWTVRGTSRALSQRPGSAVLRGRVHWVRADQEAGWLLSIGTEIRSYYLSERQAPRIERLQRDRKFEMTADIVVSPDGRAQLEQLYVEGVPAEDFEPSPQDSRKASW